MVLYIVHDSAQDTYSHPLIASTWEEVTSSFYQLNLSNLHDLTILPLSQDFDSLPELISKITLLSETTLPDPINFNRSAEVTPSATQQPKGVSPRVSKWKDTMAKKRKKREAYTQSLKKQS